MKNVFFITGLPRSGSAWWANYLTYGNTFCFHDPMNRGDAVDGVIARMAAMPQENVGVSDPALLYFAEKFIARFPEARWAFLERDPEACAAEFAPAGATREQMLELRQRMDALARRLASIRVAPPFDGPAMHRVAAALAPGFHSPDERNRMLASWNISIPMNNLVGLKFTEEHLARLQADLTPKEIWNL